MEYVLRRKKPAGLAFTQNSDTTVKCSPPYRMRFKSASLILIQDTRFESHPSDPAPFFKFFGSPHEPNSSLIASIRDFGGSQSAAPQRQSTKTVLFEHESRHHQGNGEGGANGDQGTIYETKVYQGEDCGRGIESKYLRAFGVSAEFTDELS